MYKKLFFLILAGLLLSTVFVFADVLTGEEILDSLKNDQTLTTSGFATINLITENNKGQRRVHKLKIYRKEDKNIEKQLLEYIEPADVAGTKFLSLNYKEKNENQMWLFLPALGRERRIAGHMTEEKFMGTDFTYEEIGGGNEYSEDYTAERLEDEILNGYSCYVLNLIPQDGENEYSRVKMWVYQEELMPLMIEFFNLDNQLCKKLTFEDLKEQEDGNFIPQKIVMADELAGTRTIVEILESKDEEVPDDFFTIRYLRR